jgi:hypothetical protein
MKPIHGATPKIDLIDGLTIQKLRLLRKALQRCRPNSTLAIFAAPAPRSTRRGREDLLRGCILVLCRVIRLHGGLGYRRIARVKASARHRRIRAGRAEKHRANIAGMAMTTDLATLTRRIDHVAVNLSRAPRVRSHRRLRMMNDLRKLRIERMKIELSDTSIRCAA